MRRAQIGKFLRFSATGVGYVDCYLRRCYETWSWYFVFMEACVGCNEGKASGVAKDGHTDVAFWSPNKTRQVIGDEVTNPNAKVIY